jgi:hypothetical protein
MKKNDLLCAMGIFYRMGALQIALGLCGLTVLFTP